MTVQIISKHKGKIIIENQVILFDEPCEVSDEAYKKLIRLYNDSIKKLEVKKLAPSPVVEEAEEDELDRDYIIEQLKARKIPFRPNTGTEKLAKLLNDKK